MEVLDQHKIKLKHLIEDFKSGHKDKVDKAAQSLIQHSNNSFSETAALRLLVRYLADYQTHVQAALMALEMDRRIYPDAVPDTAVEYRIIDNLVKAQEDITNLKNILKQITQLQERME